MSRWLLDESGQDMIEYALVVGVMGLAAIATLSSLTNSIGNFFSNAGNTLTNSF